MTVEEIKNEVGSVFKALTEKTDSLESKYDGLLNGEVKKLEEKFADMQEELQKQERALIAQSKINEISNSEQESETKGLFAGFMRHEGRKFTDAEKSRWDNFQEKALSVNSDPDGGYLVTPEVTGKIITRMFETSPMRGVASVMTISSDSADISISDDEADSGWTSEMGTISETDTPQIGKINIPTHEQYAQPKATQKIIDDAAVDVEAWLANEIRKKFERTENTAFVAGDGSGKPRGFTDYGAWAVANTYERGALETITSGTSGNFDSDNLIELQDALKQSYQDGAVFMCKRATFTAIRKLKNGNSDYRLLDLSTGGNVTLLGKPVIIADDMPTMDADSKSIAYGNFGVGYQIIDRIGIRVLRDPFTSKPFVKFYTTKRVGGDVIDFDAIKLLKLSV